MEYPTEERGEREGGRERGSEREGERGERGRDGERGAVRGKGREGRERGEKEGERGEGGRWNDRKTRIITAEVNHPILRINFMVLYREGGTLAYPPDLPPPPPGFLPVSNIIYVNVGKMRAPPITSTNIPV